MNNFNKNNPSDEDRSGKFGGQSFSGNKGKKMRFGGGKGGNRSSMHKAICTDCGKDCEVPFRPTGDKPVFCSDCFRKNRGGNSGKFKGGNKRDFNNRNSRPNFGNNPSHQNNSSGNTGNYETQLKQLDLKLDKILELLAPVISQETKKTKTTNKKVTAKKSVPKKKKATKKPATKKKK